MSSSPFSQQTLPFPVPAQGRPSRCPRCDSSSFSGQQCLECGFVLQAPTELTTYDYYHEYREKLPLWAQLFARSELLFWRSRQELASQLMRRFHALVEVLFETTALGRGQYNQLFLELKFCLGTLADLNQGQERLQKALKERPPGLLKSNLEMMIEDHWKASGRGESLPLSILAKRPGGAFSVDFYFQVICLVTVLSLVFYLAAEYLLYLA